jgi:hypothetical protein
VRGPAATLRTTFIRSNGERLQAGIDDLGGRKGGIPAAEGGTV